MTRPSLAGIEQRTAAATEGPWEAYEGTVGAMTGPRDCGGCSSLVSPRHEPARFWSEVARAAPADAELIAHARMDLVDLTAAVRDVLKAAAPHWENQTRREAKFNRPGSACVCEVCDIVRALATHLDLTDPEGEPT